MATATANLAKNPEGRGPSSAIPNKVVKTSEPARYDARKNRCSATPDTGATMAPMVMMPPNQTESASTYTYRSATTRHYNLKP